MHYTKRGRGLQGSHRMSTAPSPVRSAESKSEGFTVPDDVKVSHHPLVLHRLTLLRDRSTEPPLFRKLVRELAQMLFVEATQDLQLAPRVVQTPLAECAGQQLVDKIGLV